jgi:outer membrane protein assembly factor BamB
MKSNVFALDLAAGAVRWRHLFGDTNQGPNGLAVVSDRVYGATDTTAFALSAKTGRLIWGRFLVTHTQPFVDMAPQFANGLVYIVTIGQGPGGRGTLYALDAKTGALRWKFDTIKKRPVAR